MHKEDLGLIVPYPKIEFEENTHILNNPLLEHMVSSVRPVENSSEEFTKFLKNATRLMAPYVFGNLPMIEKEITTPICRASVEVIDEQSILLVPILRAGRAMLEAFQEFLPNARVGEVGLVRDENTLTPSMYSWNMPEHIEGEEVFILDSMLATGNTLRYTIDRLKCEGCKKIHTVSILAVPRGIDLIQSHYSEVEIFVAHVDEGLNRHGYIVPGLGDAGDRLYGTKK